MTGKGEEPKIGVNPTPQQILRRFVNRTDDYAVQQSDGSYRRIGSALNLDLLKRHLDGEITVGAYSIDPRTQRVKEIVFDVDEDDNADPRRVSRQIIDELKKRIPVGSIMLEASRYPDPSYHVHVFFKPMILASTARKFGEDIRLKLGKNPQEIEVFPKQSMVEEGGYGNLMKLPFGLHRVKNKRSLRLDLTTFTPMDSDLDKIVPVILEEEPSKEVEPREEVKVKFEVRLENLRPCFASMVMGSNEKSLNEKGHLHHQARLALVQEALIGGFPVDQIPSLFSNQTDYDEKKSVKQVMSLVNDAYKDGIHRYRCDTIINKYKWCNANNVEECYLANTGAIPPFEITEIDEHPLEEHGYILENVPGEKSVILRKVEENTPLDVLERVTSEKTKEKIMKVTSAPLDIVEAEIALIFDQRKRNQVQKKIEKVREKMKKAKDKIKEQYNVPTKTPPEKLPEWVNDIAEGILENGDPLGYITDAVNIIHAGDESAIKIEWISSMSAKIAKTKINSWALGKSGIGKTHLKYSVLQTLPSDHFEVFTSASPKSLFYYVKENGPNSLANLLIYIDEVESSKATLPMLRSLTSQTEITPRHLSVYDAEVLDLKILGARTVWFTSVKTFGSEQIKNRFIHVNPDETIEQDDRVFQLQDKQLRQKVEINREPFRVCKAIAKIIDEETSGRGVEIPFTIRWPFKGRRFLYPIFIAFIEVVTKARFMQRKTNENGDFIATLADFEMVRNLWRFFERSIFYRVSSSALDVYEMVPDKQENALTRSELTNYVFLSSRQIGNLCDELMDEDLINKRKRSIDGPGRGAFEYWKMDVKDISDILVDERSEYLDTIRFLREENFGNMEFRKRVRERHFYYYLERGEPLIDKSSRDSISEFPKIEEKEELNNKNGLEVISEIPKIEGREEINKNRLESISKFPKIEEKENLNNNKSVSPEPISEIPYFRNSGVATPRAEIGEHPTKTVSEFPKLTPETEEEATTFTRSVIIPQLLSSIRVEGQVDEDWPRTFLESKGIPISRSSNIVEGLRASGKLNQAIDGSWTAMEAPQRVKPDTPPEEDLPSALVKLVKTLDDMAGREGEETIDGEAPLLEALGWEKEFFRRVLDVAENSKPPLVFRSNGRLGVTK